MKNKFYIKQKKGKYYCLTVSFRWRKMNSEKLDLDLIRNTPHWSIGTPARENFPTISHNLKIIQPNILNWRTIKQTLIINYITNDPNIIVLNSHGLKPREEQKNSRL